MRCLRHRLWRSGRHVRLQTRVYFSLGPAVKFARTINPGLEKYNLDGQQTTSAPVAGAVAVLAVMSPIQDTPTAVHPSAQQQISTEQPHRQQEELERKNEELRPREEALGSGQLKACRSVGLHCPRLCRSDPASTTSMSTFR